MDTENLLRSLNEHKVRYVVIGATAFPVHGYARATLDIDIFIEATPENAQATLVALNDFGYDVTDISLEDLLTKIILIRLLPQVDLRSVSCFSYPSRSTRRRFEAL
ncbi:hypothetical protein JXQ70_14590 [bacterium]|nr:hypothetical protein [bacterium]